MNNKIELSKEKKDYMIAAIKQYFLKEREEDLGDLAAMLILDFVMEKLAPEIYNQGIEDSYMYINDKIQDVFEIKKY